jgi:hypothetical protein
MENLNLQDDDEVVETPKKRQPRIITVYGANKKERDRVAFFETNEFHPEGEAYVVNDGRPVQVAETAAVKRALGEGRLTTERVNWNSLIDQRLKSKATAKPSVPPLRNATEGEEDAAGLVTPVEKETAKVPDVSPLRRGGKPV